MVTKNPEPSAVVECAEHKGFIMRDGELVCAQCGTPSPSGKWRAQVYGVQSPEALRKAV